ncbi:hypothetical protein D5R81_18430 [Parashewanella spongiae]|uniref:Peptidase C39 domain-containing protein n=1 Tax=Parashewanella spongiae TaxID=342950 RepID=A0A3A6TLT6_9GAMM|nr:papain-like cysteine protease family protein [Parashewanella spongiae]MCL1080047.1 C39 family peptidase [Parashewanella spongiae]RJY05845.1 hypothetical protein D5R81_18430 [Parashewanella spongiae]
MHVPIILSRLVNKRKKASTSSYRSKHPNANGVYDIEYNIPYIHQYLINECGEVSFAMLLSFYYPDKTIENNAGKRGAFEGSDSSVLMRRYGLKFNKLRTGYFSGVSVEKISTILKEHGPFVCSGEFVRLLVFSKVRSGHLVIIKGIFGDKVIINDPWHGEDRYKGIDWFGGLLDKDDGYYYVDEPSLR